MADRQTPVTGTDMGCHHLKTVIVPSKIGQCPSEHGEGIKSQNNNNILNENQIADIRKIFLWGRTPWFLTQRVRHPLSWISILHGDVCGMVIPRDNNDHWYVVHKWFLSVHKDSSQWPRQRHQLPNGNHSWFLHNPRNIHHILHTGTTRHTISQG